MKVWFLGWIGNTRRSTERVEFDGKGWTKAVVKVKDVRCVGGKGNGDNRRYLSYLT